MDEDNKNRVWGVIGVIALILLVASAISIRHDSDKPIKTPEWSCDWDNNTYSKIMIPDLQGSNIPYYNVSNISECGYWTEFNSNGIRVRTTAQIVYYEFMRK